MPLEGHAPDCACCVVRIERPNKRKRTGEDANLVDFLPREDEASVGDEAEGEEEEQEADAESMDRLISNALLPSLSSTCAPSRTRAPRGRSC